MSNGKKTIDDLDWEVMKTAAFSLEVDSVDSLF
jgi:hypothetical protein